MTIANSNYEAWREGHPDALFTDFEFSAKKMSPSGALFDLDKLDNISKNYISRLTKDEVFDLLDTWTKEYDPEFNAIISKDMDYTKSILNIEREQKKPRKDFACWSDVKNSIWYMYEELYKPTEFEWNTNVSSDEIKEILDTYINEYYNESDDKETWFNKIKDLADKYGFAKEVKDYKEAPDKYKGHVGDVCELIRVAVTSKKQTPDLYEILRIFGKDTVKKRIDLVKEYL